MQPSDDLRARLLALYEAMSSTRPAIVEAFYSLQDGSIFIGTDAFEFWTDSAKHNAAVRPFFDGSYGTWTWQASEAIAFVEGSVGWTVDRPSVHMVDRAGSEASLEARVSLVWHLEDGVWRVVHSHASVGTA
jgi:adenylate cyclase